MEPSRDLAGVARLIQTAFADELDRAGRAALREMRNMSRLGPLLWWLDRMSIDFNEYLSGFVWVEGGQIVGNVTVSRAAPGSQRWIISNVAVAEPYRRQGIARALVDAAIELICERNGQVVAILLVEADDDLMLVTDSGKLIRMPIGGISVISRNTQGVKLMGIGKEERVIGAARLAEKDSNGNNGDG